jgi:hypothetical protein
MMSTMKSRCLVWITGWYTAVCLVAAAAPVLAEGGDVLPPYARTKGYSLLDMMSATALFNTSGNNPSDYPDTPFQILFNDPSTVTTESQAKGQVSTGTNFFTVAHGTAFYMPLVYADDSPPIAGDFPKSALGAVPYFFGHKEAGVRDVTVFVDHKCTSIGPAYLPGLVRSPVPLLDGGGTHIMTLGVFLTPLSKGTHTVSYEATFAGDAVFQTYGVKFLKFVNTYTVIVR